MRGKDCQCWRKGRRSYDAYHHAMDVLGEAVKESRTWPCEKFNKNLEALSAAQGGCTMVHRLAQRKLQYLDCIPWLLGQLGRAGVRKRVIQQWDAHPPHRHDPVSVHFLSPAGDLRQHIDSLPDGDVSELPLPLRRFRGCSISLSVASNSQELNFVAVVLCLLVRAPSFRKPLRRAQSSEFASIASRQSARVWGQGPSPFFPVHPRIGARSQLAGQWQL